MGHVKPLGAGIQLDKTQRRFSYCAQKEVNRLWILTSVNSIRSTSSYMYSCLYTGITQASEMTVLMMIASSILEDS